MISNQHRRGLVAAGLALGLAGAPALAASHREAPLMTLDPAADITDVYFFTSYDQANLARTGGDRRVTMIMNAVPGQELRAVERKRREARLAEQRATWGSALCSASTRARRGRRAPSRTGARSGDSMF